MRGRKPTPTVLKLAKGTRSDRVNICEPKYPAHCKAPVYLGAHGQELWAELAPLLDGAGTLTAADRHALGVLCHCYQTWRDELAPPAQRTGARKDLIRLMVEFGMTPSSRSKVTAGHTPEQELEAFLA